MNWSGFYKLNWQQRLDVLNEQGILNDAQVSYMQDHYDVVGDQQIENYLYNFGVPTGLLTKLIVDGHAYTVPMATEEPSVVAAANNGARIINTGDGVQTSFSKRVIRGQIIVVDIESSDEFIVEMRAQTATLLVVANEAYPSMVKRGGGAQSIEFERLDQHTVGLDLLVDPCEAMGANVVNTMSEAVAKVIRQLGYDVLMGILSNYATEAIVSAYTSVPVDSLQVKQGLTGLTIAKKIVQASSIEQLSPYRAVTANKGIMNGVEAVVLASGNDTRAVNASMHAFAAKNGQYQGLVNWQLNEAQTYLMGEIQIPLMVGVVGGSIGIVPAVSINQEIMGNPSAKQLSSVIAAVALAQNLAALRALVSNGIQAGHMNLQAKSLALQVGATVQEVPDLVQKLQHSKRMNQETARNLLNELRDKGDK